MSRRRELRDEFIVGTHPTLGVRTMWVLPQIPDGAPYAVREGIARRRIATLTGRCPCGAVVQVGADDMRKGELTHVEIEHEHGCPAVDAKLIKSLRRWVRAA